MATSIVTTLTPAVSRDCTTLAVVKDELGISDSSSDTRLTRWIRDASAAIVSYCGRDLAYEQLSETCYGISRAGAILLSRYPVASIDSVTVNGTALDSTAYTLDFSDGRLFIGSINRDQGFGGGSWASSPMVCQPAPIVVQYWGGYQLPASVPPPVEEAALTIIRYRKGFSARDPSIRGQGVGGVINTEYVIAPADALAPIPAEAALRLDPFREWRF